MISSLKVLKLLWCIAGLAIQPVEQRMDVAAEGNTVTDLVSQFGMRGPREQVMSGDAAATISAQLTCLIVPSMDELLPLTKGRSIIVASRIGCPLVIDPVLEVFMVDTLAATASSVVTLQALGQDQSGSSTIASTLKSSMAMQVRCSGYNGQHTKPLTLHLSEGLLPSTLLKVIASTTRSTLQFVVDYVAGLTAVTCALEYHVPSILVTSSDVLFESDNRKLPKSLTHVVGMSLFRASTAGRLFGTHSVTGRDMLLTTSASTLPSNRIDSSNGLNRRQSAKYLSS